MDLFWIIYFIDVFDVSKGAGFLTFIAVFGLFMGIVIKIAHGNDNEVAAVLTCRTYVSITVLLFLFSFFAPNKDTAYKMLAAYGVTEAYAAAQESDKVQAIAGKSLKVLEKALDDYLGKDGES